MTLKELMQADLAAMYDTDSFAENVSYTPLGGEATVIAAIVDPLESDFDEQTVRQSRIFRVAATAELGIVSPQPGDSLIYQARVYRVREARPLAGGLEWDLRTSAGGASP